MSISNKVNRIIIATKNKGKSREIKDIIKIDGVEFIDLNDLNFNDEIEETGKTFAENALIKASTVYQLYRMPVIADDSGLVVDALGGKPGVYSARYAGENATDEENYNKLLKEMNGVPDIERKARFVCVAVFYYDIDKYYLEKGEVEGYITYNPVGEEGFGYDPVFYVPEFKKTMAELPPEIKNRISHRGKAFRKLRPHIIEYIKKQK